MRDTTQEVAERFARETAAHQMTVLHDDGLYRHVRFRNPDNGFYWFDLVTWPGYLAFTGDMTGYTFSRQRDMFEFFRVGRYGINPSYWAEKLTTDRDHTKRWSEDACREYIIDTIRDLAGEHPGLWRDVKDQVLDDWDNSLGFAETAIPFLRDYTYTYTRPGDVTELVSPYLADTRTSVTAAKTTRARKTVVVQPFAEPWEWDTTEWDWTYLWACHAIAWGIQQYLDSKTAEQTPVAAAAGR